MWIKGGITDKYLSQKIIDFGPLAQDFGLIWKLVQRIVQ
jgi:hypothetical protein